MWLALLASVSYADDNDPFGPIQVDEDYCFENPNTPYVDCDIEFELPQPETRLRREVGEEPESCEFAVAAPCNEEEGDWLIRSLPVFAGETVRGVIYSLVEDNPGVPLPYTCDVTLPHQVVLFVERDDLLTGAVTYQLLAQWSATAAPTMPVPHQVDVRQYMPGNLLPFGGASSYTAAFGDRIMMALQVVGDTDGSPQCENGGIEGGVALCPVINRCPEVPVTSSWSRTSYPYTDRESLLTLYASPDPNDPPATWNAQFGVLLEP